jgi:hypothetical protein
MRVVLDDFLHARKADAAIPLARLKATRYRNSARLVIDDVGVRPLERIEANLCFRIVPARDERGSVIVTINKHARDWPDVFAGDEMRSTAILDRVLHHVHIDGGLPGPRARSTPQGAYAGRARSSHIGRALEDNKKRGASIWVIGNRVALGDP